MHEDTIKMRRVRLERQINKMNTLQVNPTTGEVFLRLPAPHENVIITPPRYSDVADIVLILNDPRVYKFLVGPPFPYQPHHAVEWVEAVKNRMDKILEDLREGKTIVDGCPVQYIREVQPDGTELFLGDVSVTRSGWPEVIDEDLREKLTKENLEKPVGDPSIVWTMGGALRNAVEYGQCCVDIPQTTFGLATTARGSCPQRSVR